jgi:hypothetical protein
MPSSLSHTANERKTIFRARQHRRPTAPRHNSLVRPAYSSDPGRSAHICRAILASQATNPSMGSSVWTILPTASVIGPVARLDQPLQAKLENDSEEA